jgi:hypothetical protein
MDGQNVTEQGRRLCEVDFEFQAKAAATLLHPLSQRVAPGENGIRRLYVIRGSRYHTGIGASDEQFFAAMVHAWRGPDGPHTRPWVHVVVGDTLFDLGYPNQPHCTGLDKIRIDILVLYRDSPSSQLLHRRPGYLDGGRHRVATG